MIRAVVFDMGGVLAYDVWEHLLPSIASTYGLLKNEVMQVGKELWKVYECPSVALESTCRNLEQHYWESFIERFRGQLSSSITTDDLKNMTDPFIRDVNNEAMIPLLERLQSKVVHLAICSNNNEFWFKRQMEKLGLDKFFKPSNLCLSYEVGFPKSSPGFEMFTAITKALGIDNEYCLFIDDRKENIEQALKYGMAGILFPRESRCGARYLNALFKHIGL